MYKRYVLPDILGLPLLAVTCNTGFAKISTDRSTVMDEVVVSESRIVTINLSIISRETIEQLASRNLGDLLSESGLSHVQKISRCTYVNQYPFFRTDTHGNDSLGKVLILLDGRRPGKA